MSDNQYTPMKFDPQGGFTYRLTKSFTANAYRRLYPREVWNYNPWTGAERDRRDIESDPTGLLIIPPGEPLYA